MLCRQVTATGCRWAMMTGLLTRASLRLRCGGRLCGVRGGSAAHALPSWTCYVGYGGGSSTVGEGTKR